MKAQRRVIDRRTAGRLYGWSHYAFNQRLLSAAATRGVHVYWTEKNGARRTCGRYGSWNADLAGSKVFHCPSTGLRVDRDVNGARNNLLSALTAIMQKL